MHTLSLALCFTHQIHEISASSSKYHQVTTLPSFLWVFDPWTEVKSLLSNQCFHIALHCSYLLACHYYSLWSHFYASISVHSAVAGRSAVTIDKVSMVGFDNQGAYRYVPRTQLPSLLLGIRSPHGDMAGFAGSPPRLLGRVDIGEFWVSLNGPATLSIVVCFSQAGFIILVQSKPG